MRFRATLLASIIALTSFAQGVIDVHSHIITPEFVSALENEGLAAPQPTSALVVRKTNEP